MLRAIGIVLIVFGGVSIATGLLAVAIPRRPTYKEADQLERLDALIPGIVLLATGFIMVAASRRESTVTAVAADQWINVPISDDAAELIRETLRERKYPLGSGVRICLGLKAAELDVKYDVISDDGSDFRRTNAR